jgi:hypothetical protein
VAVLLEAHPEADNVNLAEAAHLAETAGVPSDDLQLETFVAIRNVRTAIDNGAGGAELEPLLMHAVRVAQHWATTARDIFTSAARSSESPFLALVACSPSKELSDDHYFFGPGSTAGRIDKRRNEGCIGIANFPECNIPTGSWLPGPCWRSWDLLALLFRKTLSRQKSKRSRRPKTGL